MYNCTHMPGTFTNARVNIQKSCQKNSQARIQRKVVTSPTRSAHASSLPKGSGGDAFSPQSATHESETSKSLDISLRNVFTPLNLSPKNRQAISPRAVRVLLSPRAHPWAKLPPFCLCRALPVPASRPRGSSTGGRKRDLFTRAPAKRR